MQNNLKEKEKEKEAAEPFSRSLAIMLNSILGPSCTVSATLKVCDVRPVISSPAMLSAGQKKLYARVGMSVGARIKPGAAHLGQKENAGGEQEYSPLGHLEVARQGLVGNREWGLRGQRGQE